jgi:hypothetical protein
MTTNRTQRQTRSRSPEQTRQRMSDRVRRGVAVVSGAVEGFATELRESDLPGNTEQAVTLAGQTARRLAETGAYEVAKTRRRVQAASREMLERSGRSGRSTSPGGGMSSRGGRSSRTRSSSRLARKLPALKRKVAAKKGAIQRKVRRELPAIKRKIGAKKGAIKRKLSGNRGGRRLGSRSS